MNRFSDSQGRRWDVVIDPRQAEAVRAALNIVLPSLLDDGMRPLSSLLQDPGRLYGVLWVLCLKQAARLGVTSAEFIAMLAVPNTSEAAVAAFSQALFDTYAKEDSLRVVYMPPFKRALTRMIDRATKKSFNTTPRHKREAD